MPEHVLDNPFLSALTGPHAGFAEAKGVARRYPPDVSPFAGVPYPAGAGAWRDLADLVGPGAEALIAAYQGPVPGGWGDLVRIDGFQLVAAAGCTGSPEPEAVELGAADVPAMLELVGLTRPGPFASGTYRLGRYLGLRHAGRLVAMAGERIHLPGHVEVSAVCTHPDFRGRGLALRLVRAVVAGIRERGETPILHVAAENTGAIRLYESLGFRTRTELSFRLLRAPA